MTFNILAFLTKRQLLICAYSKGFSYMLFFSYYNSMLHLIHPLSQSRNMIGQLMKTYLHRPIHNHLHNILELFDVLPNFPFTASETKRDY